MANKKNENSSELVLRIDKEKLTTVVLLGILSLSIMFMLYTFGYGTYSKVLAEKNSDSLIYPFTDTSLNYMISIPAGFSLAETDRSNINSVLSTSSGTERFSLLNHALSSEVVSFLTLRQDSKLNQFISLSMKSAGDLTYSELEPILTEELKLGITDVTDFKVLLSKVEQDGVYFEVSAKTQNTPALYAQYSRIIGKNIVTLIHGSTVDDTDMENRLKTMMDSIILN